MKVKYNGSQQIRVHQRSGIGTGGSFWLGLALALAAYAIALSAGIGQEDGLGILPDSARDPSIRVEVSVSDDALPPGWRQRVYGHWGSVILRILAGNSVDNDYGRLQVSYSPYRSLQEIMEGHAAHSFFSQLEMRYHETVFKGYPAFQFTGENPDAPIYPLGSGTLHRYCKGYLVNVDGVWIMVQASAHGPRQAAWREDIENLFAALRFPEKPQPGNLPPGTPAASPSPCRAVIHLPLSLEPGQILSPSYTITAADGTPPKGDVFPVLYIGGKQAHSVVWDGQETIIELQVSCQGFPLSVTAVMPAYGSAPPLAVPGLGGIGVLPGPETLAQGLAGVLAPGLLAAILGILARLPPPGTTGTTGTRSGTDGGDGTHVLSDGRSYQEGRRYTFHDGVEYVMQDGELQAIRSLADGDTFVDPDGSELIWKGGQPWYAEDWKRQEATNERYRQHHAADWAEESVRLNPELVESELRHAREQALIDQLSRMQEVAVRHGMAVPGAVDDMYGRAAELLEEVRNGEIPDFEKIGRMRRYMGNRVSGFTPAPDELPPPQASWILDRDAWVDAVEESGRNLAKGSTSEGDVSWRGLLGRVGIGILTAGTSEWAFVPAAATYTMKDAVDQGASSLGAAWQGVKQALIQDLIGRGVGVAVRGVGSAAQGAYNAGTLGGWPGIVEGGVRGGAKGLKQAGLEQVQQVSDLFTKQAWLNTGHQIGQSISNGSRRLGNILSGNERYTGPSLKEVRAGAAERLDKMFGARSKLSAADQAKLSQFEKAVESGDPRRIAELYREGGMKQLGELQKKGVISPEAAKKCNAILKKQVDGAVHDGTVGAIKETQHSTGVRIREVLVADSGSSAKGTPIRLKTDADRTLIPRFHPKDLKKYATKNKISKAEAYDRLCRQFKESQEWHVDQHLRSRGLSAKDVDFANYDRIGAASGQGDSYPSSFTNARQSVDGVADVYRVNPDGTVRNPYRTSGQAAVEQNQLNILSHGTGGYELDPVRLNPLDTKPVLKQQIDAVFKSGKSKDPQAIAKTIDRWHKQASIGQHAGGSAELEQLAKASQGSLNQISPRLLKTSRAIRQNPELLDTILKQNHYADLSEFLAEGADSLRYADNLFDLVL